MNEDYICLQCGESLPNCLCCEWCNGIGDCFECSGTGKLEDTDIDCEYCDGTGECIDCLGTGEKGVDA